MSLVSLDTQVLTWCVQALFAQQVAVQQKQPAKTTKEIDAWAEKKALAASLVQELQDSKTTISLPSIVLAEFLCAVPTAKHQAALGLLAKNFVVHPFDLPAALAFAELYKLRHGDGTIDSMMQDVPRPTREKIKADLVVVATALRWQADRIYSHDGAVKKLAQGKIKVVEMPPKKPVQTKLLGLFPKSEGKKTST